LRKHLIATAKQLLAALHIGRFKVLSAAPCPIRGLPVQTQASQLLLLGMVHTPSQGPVRPWGQVQQSVQATPRALCSNQAAHNRLVLGATTCRQALLQ
jgi:hypothetical protein